jgi:hypothetical protein
MSSPDYTLFIDTLVPGHQAWVAANPAPSGDDFFNHYVGDLAHPNAMLWQYEGWRAEHGYTRVRPWNGSEGLGRVATADITAPGTVVPYPIGGFTGGPALNANLQANQTTAQLQASFGSSNALGTAILNHWNSVKSYLTPGFANGDASEIADEGFALYSIRFWGFMKWSNVMRNKWQGIPVFDIPIVYDADGVPLSDIEFMDLGNYWHRAWHLAPTTCTQTTAAARNNPFAPVDSPFGQICFGDPSSVVPAEFLTFHRDVVGTFNKWRARAGMPPIQPYRPVQLHFHQFTVNNNPVAEVDLAGDPNGSAAELNDIKSVVRHFYAAQALATYLEGNIHGPGHLSPENPDIADVASNNYSPRFFGWHRWIDRLWEIRQPRLDSFRSVDQAGGNIDRILTMIRPTPNPDQAKPDNALTGITGQGQGSLWIAYNVRPETWSRAINLNISAQVYLNSMDLTPVAGLDAVPITVNAVPQGVDSGPVELRFTGLDGGGQGAFATVDAAGVINFKNARIRVTAHLTPVGAIPGSFATGSDQIDYHESFDIFLVKDNQAPQVSTLLNRSAFSLDEIVVNASGAAQSAFSNSVFVVVQDPGLPATGFDTPSIFADPARNIVSGIFTDPSLVPSVQAVDDMNNPVTWFTVTFTDAFPEQPSLSDNAPQRFLFRHRITFDVAAMQALLPNPGDSRTARIRIGARDRAGNAVAGVLSAPIQLFHHPHPYMIDVIGQNPYWLSVDTRVFSVKQNDTAFNHSVTGSGSPEQYIQDVINEFNSGTQNFDGIPQDENQAPLELSPQVGGVNVYNFALARVRMGTQAVVSGVQTFFRLFTTAVSDLSFTNTNYPNSGGGTPIALLGRTGGGAEIVSIPCFAAPRLETRDAMGGVSMTTQPDPANVQTFAISPAGGETIRYFGALLDINSDTPRYPAAPSGDGPFPIGECVSIRNIIRGQHQCMVAEVFLGSDPTDPASTPATSDHLAQRNLLIIETANPGIDNITHTAQHSFDIVLLNRDQKTAIVNRRRIDRISQVPMRNLPNEAANVTAAVPPAASSTFGDPAGSVRYPGFDELVFLWNNLPTTSKVEVYLPFLTAEYPWLVRELRRAPRTVRVADGNTLSLAVQGVSYLPIPNIGLERLPGLLTVTLPDGIKAGEVYTVDVMHMRPATGMILGGFRLTIPVKKAAQIYNRALRLLPVFEERLSLTPGTSRWYPILRRQVDYFRARALGLAQEAAQECCGDIGKGTRLRVILERIKILDAFGPLVHGSGQLQLTARVTSSDGGGIGRTTQLPPVGSYPVPDFPVGYVIDIGTEIFRGSPVDSLHVEIFGADAPKGHRCYYHRQFKGKPTDWFGNYKPRDERPDPEDVGDWQVWYRIEGA